ncbi:MAG: hypothetical protein IKA36_00420 [Clostridia bacterium]|nr:hypothetical protein [Clostridia bacterium]
MANLETNNPSLVKIGDTIKYTLKDLNDTTVYSGRVVAICDYESARAYADILAIHQAMLAADIQLGDITTFRFLIVEGNDGVRRPVGYEIGGDNSWFTNNSVEIIDVGTEYTIKLFNASASDASLAIRVPNEQGFSCKLVK